MSVLDFFLLEMLSYNQSCFFEVEQVVNRNFEECRIKANIIAHTQGEGERVCCLIPLSLPIKKTIFGSCRDS